MEERIAGYAARCAACAEAVCCRISAQLVVVGAVGAMAAMAVPQLPQFIVALAGVGHVGCRVHLWRRQLGHQLRQHFRQCRRRQGSRQAVVEAGRGCGALAAAVDESGRESRRRALQLRRIVLPLRHTLRQPRRPCQPRGLPGSPRPRLGRQMLCGLLQPLLAVLCRFGLLLLQQVGAIGRGHVL